MLLRTTVCKPALKTDEAYLKDLVATREQKASFFESGQQLRAEEIVAVKKASEIVSGGAVSSNADKHSPAALLQKPALARLRADSSSQKQMRVSAYLHKRSALLELHALYIG